MMTPEQQAQYLNTKPSGKTGRWYVEKDGSGVFYIHGKRRV